MFSEDHDPEQSPSFLPHLSKSKSFKSSLFCSTKCWEDSTTCPWISVEWVLCDWRTTHRHDVCVGNQQTWKTVIFSQYFPINESRFIQNQKGKKGIPRSIPRTVDGLRTVTNCSFEDFQIYVQVGIESLLKKIKKIFQLSQNTWIRNWQSTWCSCTCILYHLIDVPQAP